MKKLMSDKNRKIDNYKTLFDNFKQMTTIEWEEKLQDQQRSHLKTQNELDRIKKLLEKKDITLDHLMKQKTIPKVEDLGNYDLKSLLTKKYSLKILLIVALVNFFLGVIFG